MSGGLLPGAEFEPNARRARLLSTYGVDLVIDIGANTGQYATSLREAGYAGRIVSFEPGSAAFASLCRRAAADAHWDAIVSRWARHVDGQSPTSPRTTGRARC